MPGYLRWRPSLCKKRAGPNEPSARRLRALMRVLGFEGWGAQVRFAKRIGGRPQTPKQRSDRLSAKLAARPDNYSPLSSCLDRLPPSGLWRQPGSKPKAAIIELSKKNWGFSLYPLSSPMSTATKAITSAMVRMTNAPDLTWDLRFSALSHTPRAAVSPPMAE